jgi:hypothetical protein
VSYVVFRHPNGAFDVSQQCWIPEVLNEVRATYGSRADSKIEQLVGTTGKARTYAILDGLSADARR